MSNNQRTGVIARLGVSSIALGVVIAASPAQAACTTSGTTLTCDTAAPNPDSVAANVTAATVTVGTGATLNLNSGAVINPAGATAVITNSGTIVGTNGRAINFTGSPTSRTITITNNAGATIKGVNDDAVRINFVPSGGTITVNNSGLIQTTNGGQAIDFDAISTSSATVIINNLVTGEIRSFAADAIRPGQGATVNNAGLIFSDGPADSTDGVDWQDRSGTVNNLATGTISGLRHGITGNGNVIVTNAGTIIGRNGSGVGSDGVGTVTNTGTITGKWDGVQANGDSDGVDIDGIGTVINSGTIEGLTAAGVDSGLRPNSAQGVAMGGGSITNNAGGTIYGGAQGVLINRDTNPGGVADGATTIVNAGTIRGGSAEAIQFVGNFADSIATSGTIIGGNGTALDMGGGDDALTITGAASFTGLINGGAGTDTIILGTTTGNTLQGVTNFEKLVITGSGWTLGQTANFSGGIAVDAGGALTGNSTTLVGPIANAGTLTVDQATDGTFAAALTGNGGLVKTGDGALIVGSLPGFTGPTTVAKGRLVLAGTLPGTVTVQNGATLAGNGTVGATTILTGGIIAPGNSIGTIIVNGDFNALTGSSYLAETSSTGGTTDLIAITGTATLATGAGLQIVRDATPYTIGYRYVVLTATGGVNGTYTLSQAADPLTEFRLGKTATSVYVDVARSAAGLIGVGATPNQAATAAGLGSLGVANAAYAALTLIPSDTAVRAGLDALSGEIHGTVFTALLDDAAAVQSATRTRLLDSAEGTAGASIWATGLRRWGANDGNGIAAKADSEAWGVIGGIDTALGETFRAGIAGGLSWTDLTVAPRASTARANTTHVLAYAGGTFGALRLNLTAGYAWSDVTTHRSVAFTGFADSLSANYKARTLHGGADLGYQIPFGGGSVEPFVGVEIYNVRSKNFAETGGAAALIGTAAEETHTISTLGARFSTPITGGLSARGQLGWRHAFGDLAPVALLRYAGSATFGIQGAPLSEDAAAAEIALRYTTGNVALTGSYNGTIGKTGSDSRFQLGLAIAF